VVNGQYHRDLANQQLTSLQINKKTNQQQVYFLHGKLTAKAGHTDELANILLEASQKVSAVKGCKLYVIGKDANDAQAVYITEIWDSKEDHDNSLKQDDVRALIAQAMPIIDGLPQKGQELEILGGLGI
jgi:quinol monooxygenase YgiN